MAMIEIGGKGDVKVKDSTTTADTLIKSIGENSDLKADVDNCHAGVPHTKTYAKGKGLLVKLRDLVLENLIKSALAFATPLLLGYLAHRFL
ncbi:hypothetical protein HRJ41_21465 [Pseudomonas sp. BF61]|uniref:hypothetical protein n=1 Tax=Pseudomonas sp. BF61 TaxID=2741068 RepID=UPI001C0B1B08|nr:hypothetical protein [Pseudomonas sp. BF61]MBU4630043.1 hypothetical protein [Pseudomonas sp. BF61]